MKISVTTVQAKIPLAQAKIRTLARAAALRLDPKQALSLSQVSIVFVNDEEIARINQQFLRHQGPTDVISFIYSLPPPHKNGSDRVGEIIISVTQARAQARRFRRPVTEELIRYIVHGLLHFSGYNDATPQQRRKMRRAENKLLKEIQLQGKS